MNVVSFCMAPVVGKFIVKTKLFWPIRGFACFSWPNGKIHNFQQFLIFSSPTYPMIHKKAHFCWGLRICRTFADNLSIHINHVISYYFYEFFILRISKLSLKLSMMIVFLVSSSFLKKGFSAYAILFNLNHKRMLY